MSRRLRRQMARQSPAPMAPPGPLLDEAMAHHQAGRLAQAEPLYQSVLKAQPEHPDALHLLGVLYYQHGRHEEAERLIRRAIARVPAVPEMHNNLGNALRAQGRPEDAAACFRKALALRPDFVEAMNNLGAALDAAGAVDAAGDMFEAALRLRPSYPEPRRNLAWVRLRQERWGEAEACLRAALQVWPEDAQMAMRLGVALRHQDRMDEAADAYRRALELRPDYPDAHSNLAAALLSMDDLDGAERHARRALELEPSSASARTNLASLMRRRGRHEEAGELLEQACALDATLFDAWHGLGNLRLDEGRPEEAIARFAHAHGLRPNPALLVKQAVALPAIPQSLEEMRQWRARWVSEVDRLLASASPGRVDHMGMSSFFLAYHGEDDRPLQERLARLYLRLQPDLAWTAPHCLEPEPLAGRRIRVGFVSRFLRRHTIGKLFRGIVAGLDRDRFETVVLQIGADDDGARAIAEGADRAVALGGDVAAMRARIAAERLDVLFYTDVGMEPITYLLAFARLAPRQMVSWGHPVTTGIPNMDVYVSSDLVEPEGAQAHYSERLARLSTLPACYARPSAEARPDRAGFGFGDEERVYACPQTLFKLHPDFDALLAQVLRRDPRGRVALVEGNFRVWNEQIMARLRGSMPDVADRVTLLPRMPEERFLSLLASVDVLLDPIHFGSGNTAYEAFAVGTPVVTLPGAYMRGRVTLGCYRRMGLESCVARDAADYVEKAFRLANDPAWRAQVSSEIRLRSAALYDDAGAVRELEALFSGPD